MPPGEATGRDREVERVEGRGDDLEGPSPADLDRHRLGASPDDVDAPHIGSLSSGCFEHRVADPSGSHPGDRAGAA
jgi:hypothetical protein